MGDVAEGFPRFKEDKPKPEKTIAQKRGANNRRKGRTKQNHARKTLERVSGVESSARFRGLTANEEAWRLPVRVEVKAGKQVEPIATRFTAAQTQSERNTHSPKSVGDARPFMFVAMPDGWGKDGLVVCRLSQLGEVIDALGGVE